MTVIAVSLCVMVIHGDDTQIHSFFKCQIHFNYYLSAKDGRNTSFFQLLRPPCAYIPDLVQQLTRVVVPLLAIHVRNLPSGIITQALEKPYILELRR